MVITGSVKCLSSRCRHKSKWCIFGGISRRPRTLNMISFQYCKRLNLFWGARFCPVETSATQRYLILHYGWHKRGARAQFTTWHFSSRSESFSFSWKLFGRTNRGSFISTLFWLQVMGANITASYYWWFVLIGGFKVMSVSLRFIFFLFLFLLDLDWAPASLNICVSFWFLWLLPMYSNTFWKCL